MHIPSCSSYWAASGGLYPGQDPGRALLMPTQDALRRGLRMLRARPSGLPMLSRHLGTRHCSRHGPLPLGGGRFKALPPERAGSSRPRPQPTRPQQFKAWIFHELGGGILETVLALVSIAVTLGGIAVTLVVRRAQATGVLPVIGSLDSGPHLVHTAAPKAHPSDQTSGSRSTPSAETVAVEARDGRSGAGAGAGADADRPAAAADTTLPYGASPADDAFDTPWSDLSRWAVCCMQYQEALAEQVDANVDAATIAASALPTMTVDAFPSSALITAPAAGTTTTSQDQRHRHRQQTATSAPAGVGAAAAPAAAPTTTQQAAASGGGVSAGAATSSTRPDPALVRGARAALRLTGQVAELPLRVVDWALKVDQPVRASVRGWGREVGPATTASPAAAVAASPPSVATCAEPPGTPPLPVTTSAPPSADDAASPTAPAMDAAVVDINAVASPHVHDLLCQPQRPPSSQAEATELKPSIAAAPPPSASEPAADARRWVGDLKVVPSPVAVTADRVVHVLRDAATGVRSAAAAATDAAAAQLSMYGKGPSASAPPAVSQLPGGAATAVFALALSSWLSAWAVVLLGRAATRVLGRVVGGRVAAAAKGRGMTPREYFGPWYDVVQQMGPARTCVPLCTPPPPPLQLLPQRPSLLTAAAAAAVATPPLSSPAETPNPEAVGAAEAVAPQSAVARADSTAPTHRVGRATAAGGEAGGHDLAAADSLDSSAELLRLKPPPASRSGWPASAAAAAGLKPNPSVLPDLGNQPGLTAASLAAAATILSDYEVRALRRWAANDVVAPRQGRDGAGVVRQSDVAADSNADGDGAGQGEGCEDGDAGYVEDGDPGYFELSRLLSEQRSRLEETFGGRSEAAENRPGPRPHERDEGTGGERPIGGGDATALDNGAAPRALQQQRWRRRMQDLRASRAAKRAAAADLGSPSLEAPMKDQGSPSLEAPMKDLGSPSLEAPMKDAAVSTARSQPETGLDARDSNAGAAAAAETGGAGGGEGKHRQLGPACELKVPLAVPLAVPVPPARQLPLSAAELAMLPLPAPSCPLPLPAPSCPLPPAAAVSGTELPDEVQQRGEVEPAALAGTEPRTATSSAAATAAAAGIRTAAEGAIVKSTLSVAGLQVSATISQPGTALVIKYLPTSASDTAPVDAEANAASATAEPVGDAPPDRSRVVGAGEEDGERAVLGASEAKAYAEGSVSTGTDGGEKVWHQRPGYVSPESRMYYQRLQRSEQQSPGNAAFCPLPPAAAKKAEAPSDVGEVVALRDTLMPVVVRPEEKRIVVAPPAAPAPAVEGNGGSGPLASARRSHGHGPTRGSLHSQTVTVTIDADGSSGFNTVQVDLVPAATQALPAALALPALAAALPGGVSEPLALAAPAASVALLPPAAAAAVEAVVDVAAEAAAAATVEAVTELVVDSAVVANAAVVAAIADAAAAAAATAALHVVNEIVAAEDAAVEAEQELTAAGAVAKAESQAPPAGATAIPPPELPTLPAPPPSRLDNWAFYAGQYNGMAASELLPYGHDGKAAELAAGCPPSGAPNAPAEAPGGPVVCWSCPVETVEALDAEAGSASLAAASPVVEAAATDATDADGLAADTAAAVAVVSSSVAVDSAPATSAGAAPAVDAAPAAAGGEQARVPSGRVRFARYTGVPELDRLAGGTGITPGSWAATGSVRMGCGARRVSDGTLPASSAAAKKAPAGGPSPEAVAEAAPRPRSVVRRSSFRTRAALLHLQSDQVRAAAAAAATAAGAAAAATLNGVRLEELFSGPEATAACEAVAASAPADVVAPPAPVAPSAATATATTIPSPVPAAASSGASRGFVAAETASGEAVAAAAAPPAASTTTTDVAAAAAAAEPLVAGIAAPAAAARGVPPPDVLALEDEDVEELAVLAAAASGAATTPTAPVPAPTGGDAVPALAVAALAALQVADSSAAYAAPVPAPLLQPPSVPAADADAAPAASSALAAVAAPAVAAVPTSEDQATGILVLEDEDVEELAVLAAAASGAATAATASDLEEEQQVALTEQAMALTEDTELVEEEAEDGSDVETWSAFRLPLVDDGGEEEAGGSDGSVGTVERPLSRADVIAESAVRMPPSWVSSTAQAAMAPAPGGGVVPSPFAGTEPSSEAIAEDNGLAAAAASSLSSSFKIVAPPAAAAAAAASGEAGEDEDEEAIIGWLVDLYSEISSDEEDEEGHINQALDDQTAGAATTAAAAAAAVAAAGAARSASMPGAAPIATPGGPPSQAAMADATTGVVSSPVPPAAALDSDVRLPVSDLARGFSILEEEVRADGRDEDGTRGVFRDVLVSEEDGTRGVFRDVLVSEEADGGGYSSSSSEDQAMKWGGDGNGVDGASVPIQGLSSRGGDSEEEEKQEEEGQLGAPTVLRGFFIDIWADDDSEGEAKEGAEGEGKGVEGEGEAKEGEAAKGAVVGGLSALLGSYMVDEKEGKEQEEGQEEEEDDDLDSFEWDFDYNDNEEEEVDYNDNEDEEEEEEWAD